MVYLNEEIPCKFLHGHPIVPSAEIIYIEFHQLKRNWLLGFYKPPIQSDLGFLVPITKVLDFYLFITQPAITCSKLTIETLEQGVKYVQS